VASPISTGGGGIHFESRVTAYYFTSLLNGGTVLGHLPGSSVSAVKCQRKDEGNPLDDIKIYCDLSGDEGRLDLQVKRTLLFGDNALFKEVIGDCWDTFWANKDDIYIRYGVAIGTIEKSVENEGRKVLNWARQSDSEQDFFERLATPNFASDGMRQFLETIRSGVESAKGVKPTGDDFWSFLRRFVVLYFDFESGESSHSLVEVTDRLRNCLSPDEADKPLELWNALTAIADQTKPAAGSHNRATLIESLAGRFQIVGQGPIAADFKRIHDFTQRVLGDMHLDVLGSFVPRVSLHSDLAEALSRHRVVEIVGEAGAGKSALARSHIENEVPDSNVLALSSRRLSANEPGWEGFARHLGLKSSLSAIITELSSSEAPMLLIDGTERIGAPAIWATINDILTAVATSPGAARWKILVTSRKNNLRHREQIDFRQLDMALGRVSVEDFSDEELDQIAGDIPQLRQLVARGSRARPIAKRPYFLRRLAENGVSSEDEFMPVSEIDLMLDFWRTTSNEDSDPDAALYKRQEALLQLGNRRLSNLDGPISSLNVDAASLAELARDDVVRHDVDLRQVSFAHDIIEDWVLCFALQHDEGGVVRALIDKGEPLRLLDSVQLLGQWRIERCADSTEWRRLLNEMSGEDLQPRWRRAVLSSPLLSTRATNLLKKVEPALRENSEALLDELMGALRTIEVDPNPYYLSLPILAEYTESDIAKLSRMYAIPRLRSWQPFINWYLPLVENLPHSLVKETSLLFETIAQGYDAVPKWMAETVASWASKNLRQLSYGDDFHTGYDKVRKYLDDIGVERDEKFKERLLSVLLRCVDGAPQTVSDHLSWISEEDRQTGAEYVIENSNLIAKTLPDITVDFLLSVLVPPPTSDEELYGFSGSISDFNELGIKHDRLFFNASHLRPPFLALLANNECEGLRLIRELCNAAMDRWQEILRDERSGTPLPLILKFDWGEQEFWGHYREYTWNRGMGPGPYTVMSALMALEVWMELEIERGRDLNDLFRTVLHDNYCVGVVGACCAVLLKYPEKCMAVSLPFLTNPKIWTWDIQRLVQDGNRNSNTIGFRDFSHRDAVSKRNASPHRKLDIRSLIPSVLLQGTPELKVKLIKTVSTLQNEEPDFDFEEEKENPEIIAEAKERLERMVAICDPKNYEITENEDGKSFIFQYVPPPSLAPDEHFLEQHNEWNESIGLATWAEESLTTGVIQDRWALTDAIKAVRGYQDEIDFTSGWPPVEDLAQRAKIGALVGTAALVLSYNECDSTEFGWAKSIIIEAANMPLEDDGITFPDSLVSFHPVVSAAHGFLALLRRNETSQENYSYVLLLSLYPLNAVKSVIFNGLKDIWSIAPKLCWEVLILGTRLCVMPENVFSSSTGAYGLQLSKERLEWIEGEWNQSLAALANNEVRELPRVSGPWKLKSDPNASTDSQESYERAEHHFLWDQLQIVLFSQPLNELLEVPEQRSQIVRLLDDLIKWTEMDLSHFSSASLSRSGCF